MPLKRAFDLVAAAAGLVLLSPLLLLVAIAVRLDSRGPVLFRQSRVGRNLRVFDILKFRTMVTDAPRQGPCLTVGEDPRVTRVGRVLRRFKIDELPQLVNVVTGDMSLVGPRPEVPRYVELYRDDFQTVLQLRPGITGLASLRYRNESDELAKYADPEEAYRTRVLPRKLALAKLYCRRASLGLDVLIILRTVTGWGGTPRSLKRRDSRPQELIT